MIRLLCLVACLFLSACASAEKNIGYVRATGEGSSLQEAKQQAFSRAIEIQVGVIILSERESNKYDLIKNDILAYSSGYVDDFRIVSQHSLNGVTTLTVDVKVAGSRIADRLLGSGKSPKTLEGEQLATQYNSYLDNKSKGDALLGTVLNDFPHRAFYIKQGPHQLKVDVNRNGVLGVPFEMGWNYNYIVSLGEALGLLHDGSNGLFEQSPGRVIILVKDPKDMFFGKKTNYLFNDMTFIRNIRAAFTLENAARIKIEIKDTYGRPVFSECREPDAIVGNAPPFFSEGDANSRDILIHGNVKDKGKMEILIRPNSPLTQVLMSSGSVELSVVPIRKCYARQ